MARQIGKMLNAREPKVVNGPEILNKFVGQSEENVRKLFADAEKEVSPVPLRVVVASGGGAPRLVQSKSRRGSGLTCSLSAPAVQGERRRVRPAHHHL